MNAPREGVVSYGLHDLTALFNGQRAAFTRDPWPDLAARRDRLARLRAMLHDEAAWVDAIERDFGHRSAQETRLAELYIVDAEARHAHRHVARWMHPQRVATPVQLWPGSARILRQPRGVVGVISPWNYPVQLALAPVVAALAAGNRVLLKPSELTPATSALLAERATREFAADEFAVVVGDAALGIAFADLRFDHLFFTGSTGVGRQVAQAAARNLTPVTLELGGKSPAVFDRGADLRRLAPRLMVGKLLNAGQTCIAPDYALVPRSEVERFVEAVTAATAKLYPESSGGDDYTAIINERHRARLAALLDDARQRGARIVELAKAPGAHPRQMAPALVVGVDDRMAIMREEIFGPLLPVEAYDNVDDAIARINRRPHPLAMYWFGDDRARLARVLRETHAGGVTVNDTLWHFAHQGLPFGGIGASGSGAYHGEHGFRTFTHDKPVFAQARRSPSRLLHPPYGKTFERLLGVLKRL